MRAFLHQGSRFISRSLLRELYMFSMFRQWYEKYFSSEEIIVLLLLIVGAGVVITFFGKVLAPFFTAVVVAYLLQGLVSEFLRRGMPRMVAITLVYFLFLGFLVLLLFVLLPLSWGQLVAFVEQQLPRFMMEGFVLLEKLPEQYPQVISQTQIDSLVQGVRGWLNTVTNDVLSFSFSAIPNLFGTMIFIVLVPVLVFFLLKDKELLLNYVLSFLPENRTVLSHIWQEMELQVSNYVRGKCAEIVIVGCVTYLSLLILGVNYALLLGVLVGLSVVVPYIGAAVVTLPVAVVGYFQFGWGSEWATLMIVYGVIQALDGNVLVPLLFSEAVNLHPVSIIVAVLMFGGIWGIWGVFFAIPLATMIKSVRTAWALHVNNTDQSENLEQTLESPQVG